MESRAVVLNESKDSTVRAQSRIIPSNLLRLLLLFLVFGLGFFALSIYMTRVYMACDSGNQSIVSSIQLQTPVCKPSCLEESKNLKGWISPPPNLMHTMTDEELFWRASFVPQVKKYPFERVPKVAFMFLTKGPLPLYPLWERFFEGHERLYSIYIHSLPSYQAVFPSTSIFYKRQIPSKLAEWGKMSMCDAERRLLANALLEVGNEWFVLLSESCIPLFSFPFVYNYLIKSQYSFLGAFDDLGPYGRGRYDLNMAPEVNISKWRKGSQWFAISRKLAIYIIKDTKFYHKFNEFCKPHCYVDEHYFPTMLTIEVPHLLANRSITWVDWSRGGAHPATFGKADITEAFLNNIIHNGKCKYNVRNDAVCYLFARKFAPSALESLLELAPKFLQSFQ